MTRRLAAVALLTLAVLMTSTAAGEAGTGREYVRSILHGRTLGSYSCGSFDCVGNNVVSSVEITGIDQPYSLIVTIGFEYRTTQGDDMVLHVWLGSKHREMHLAAAETGTSAVARFFFRNTDEPQPWKLTTGVSAGPHAKGVLSFKTRDALITVEAAR